MYANVPRTRIGHEDFVTIGRDDHRLRIVGDDHRTGKDRLFGFDVNDMIFVDDLQTEITRRDTIVLCGRPLQFHFQVVDLDAADVVVIDDALLGFLSVLAVLDDLGAVPTILQVVTKDPELTHVRRKQFTLGDFEIAANEEHGVFLEFAVGAVLPGTDVERLVVVAHDKIRKNDDQKRRFIYFLEIVADALITVPFSRFVIANVKVVFADLKHTIHEILMHGTVGDHLIERFSLANLNITDGKRNLGVLSVESFGVDHDRCLQNRRGR